MTNLFMGLITAAVLVAVGVFVAVMIELKCTLRYLREFLKTRENSLTPTLEELQQDLKSLRNVTDNISAVTEDVKVFSRSVREVGENVKLVSDLVGAVTSASSIKVSALRTGVRTAVEVFARGLAERKAKS